MSDWNLVVGPASLVVGTTLGWYLQQRGETTRAERDELSEQRRWQRDRRLDAYAAFIAPTQQYMFQASILDRTDYTPETVTPARAQLAEILDRIGQAVGAMTFVAPKPVTQMAMEIEALCLETYELVVGPTWIRATPDGAARWSALGRWLGTWTASAHADLDGNPIETLPLDLPDTPRWRTNAG